MRLTDTVTTTYERPLAVTRLKRPVLRAAVTLIRQRTRVQAVFRSLINAEILNIVKMVHTFIH